MLKTTISKSEFKAKALEYMRFVEQNNQPIIVTDMGTPVIQVQVFQPKSKSDPYDYYRGSVLKYVGPNKPLDLEDWGRLK
ncbi:MAG: type II toxin-antitoxin system Phd/YefM family antitoxin [bacterium]